MSLLDELRAKPPVERPSVVKELCLDQALLGEIAAAAQALQEAAAEFDGRPRKSGEGGRVVEARDALAGLNVRLAEASAQLVVRARWSNGEWRTFVDANPARDEGTPGGDRDGQWGSGVVNVDALIDRVGEFAESYDGDELKPGDWERLFVPAISNGDLYELAGMVVLLYEQPADFRALRVGLSGSLARLRDSAGRESSD